MGKRPECLFRGCCKHHEKAWPGQIKYFPGKHTLCLHSSEISILKIVFLFIFYTTADFPEDQVVRVGPAFFPRLLAAGLGIFSAILFLSACIGKYAEIHSGFSIKDPGVQRGIISVSGGSFVKGIIAGLFGLLVSTIGFDPVSGYPRFTLGMMDLLEGPALIPTLIGLFAFSEVFKGVETIATQKQIGM